MSTASCAWDKKNSKHPLTSGFFLQWERVQSAFIPGSNDSAVVLGIYQFQLRSAVRENDTRVDTLIFAPFPAQCYDVHRLRQ